MIHPSIIGLMLRSRTTRGKRQVKGRRRVKARTAAPVWEELLRIARTIPESDLHKLPTDMSVNHDHYLRGGNGS